MSTEDFYIEASEETLQLNYCALASVVLVFYEHSLTLADEIRLIWASKMTGPKVLFVAARYILWAICLVQIWLIFPQSNRTKYDHRSNINLYQYSTSVYAIVLNVGIKSMCDWGFMVSQNIGLMISIATGACTITIDLIVLIITWYRTYKLARHASRNHMKTSLSSLLLRDGTLHFVLLTLVTVINMATWPSPGIVSQDITYFQATIPNIVICRFLLNLRQLDGASGMSMAAQDHELSTTDYHGSNGSNSVRFASRIVGNMGEYLHDDDTFHASEHDEELSTGVEQEVLEPEE